MSDRLRTLIAWWQIVCAVLGLLLFAAAVANLLPDGRRWLADVVGPINLLGGVAFFAFALAAGRGLLRRRLWALRGSLAVQLLQAVSVAILGGPHIQIAAGPALNVTVGSQRVAAQLGFHSSFFLGTRVQGAAWEVTVNVLALVWAAALLRALRSQQAALTAPAV